MAFLINWVMGGAAHRGATFDETAQYISSYLRRHWQVAYDRSKSQALRILIQEPGMVQESSEGRITLGPREEGRGEMHVVTVLLAYDMTIDHNTNLSS